MDPGLVSVRTATLDDVEGIRTIHANCEDPWAHPGIGPVWVNHRLLHGFMIDVATVYNTVVGHAEWNMCDEPAPYGRYLYLGMLQVHDQYQRKGIGKAMVAAGIERARSLLCQAVRTMAEPEVLEFYAKCGFKAVATINTVDLEASGPVLPSGWLMVDKVPHSVTASLPFRLGWLGQASSTFMWEICNHPIRIAGEQEQHPCARFNSGQAYVQLRHCGGSSALAVAWAVPGIALKELIEVAQALAASLGIATVTVSVINAEQDELSSLVGNKTIMSPVHILERTL